MMFVRRQIHCNIILWNIHRKKRLSHSPITGLSNTIYMNYDWVIILYQDIKKYHFQKSEKSIDYLIKKANTIQKYFSIIYLKVSKSD